MLQYEYAREALKNGLAMETGSFGTNPYKFGMVGSSPIPTPRLLPSRRKTTSASMPAPSRQPGRWKHPMAKFAGRQYDGLWLQ